MRTVAVPLAAPAAPVLGRAFVAGAAGPWRIESVTGVIGESLPFATHLDVVDRGDALSSTAAWVLRGTTSNLRYTDREETETLAAIQEGLGRESTRETAFIAIRKSAAWWALAQDERRAIFEEQSHHIGIGLDYLPGVARRLYHSRDLGEPFDFLTWFEFAPHDRDAFDSLLARLRATAEWTFVDREVEIRMHRGDGR